LALLRPQTKKMKKTHNANPPIPPKREWPRLGSAPQSISAFFRKGLAGKIPMEISDFSATEDIICYEQNILLCS
jgi:hypothetical protein